MLERKNDEGIGKNADDDRRRAVQQVRGVTHDKSGGRAAEFREINGTKESDGNADERSEQKHLPAADDGVGHATAGFADGRRQLGKEVPTDRYSAVIDKVAKNQEEHGNRNQGAHAGHGEHEAANKLAPAETRGHTWPISLPRCAVARMSRRASPLRMKVRRNSTNPSSIRD